MLRRYLLANLLKRVIQLCEISHHEQQLAQRQHARAHVPHAHEQYGRGSQHGQQADLHSEPALDQGQAQARPHPLARA